MKITRTLATVSVAALLTLAACSSGTDQDGSANPGGQPAASDGGQAAQEQVPQADVSDVPEVVAEVNGEEITRDEFVQSYEPQFQQAAMTQQSTGQGEVDEAELKTQVAEQLVDNRLLAQGAADAGIEASDEDIDATLEEIAANNGLGSADEVVSALEEQGYSAEQVREDAATQFELSEFIAQEADIQEPSEEELRTQYEEAVEQQEQAAAAAGEEDGAQSQIPPFEDVRDQLAQQSVSQQENEAAVELAAELRESGDVTVHI